MSGPRTSRIALLRLALGVAAALLLAGLIIFLVTREPARMTASAAGFAGRAVSHGAQVYTSACAGCHGVAGQGVPDLAPALNSAAFFTERLGELNYQGDLRSFIEGTVAAGRPVKNEKYGAIMPAWAQQYGGALRADEIRDVASYILNWQAAPSATTLAPAPATEAVGDDGGAAAAGKAYFGSRDCLGCHGWPGRGGITGPDLAGIALRGGEQMPGVDAEGYIRISILAPSAYIAKDCPPGPCPDMMPRDYGEQLGPRELEILVRYLLTLTEPRPDRRPRGAPAPLVGGLRPEDAHLGDTPLERGKTLYGAHCQQCHGDRGQGGMGTALGAVLISVDPVRYARAATAQGVPGSLMPAWEKDAGGPLSASELDDLALYVVELAREYSEASNP